MLEFVVWLVLFTVVGGIVLFVRYWYELINRRDSYTRDELVDFVFILVEELKRLTTRSGETAYNYGALVFGIASAWVLTLFGGLVSPGTAGMPDHASSQVTNYFFQSVLSVGILHLIWPSFRDSVGGQGGPAAQLLRAEVPYFFGLAVGLGALNLTLWGVYHDMNFLFCFTNMVACAAYAGWRLQGQEEDDFHPGNYPGDYPDDIPDHDPGPPPRSRTPDMSDGDY